MAFNTVLQQGSFTSDGLLKYIQLRSDVDWMWVYNRTVIAAAGNDVNAQFYWQKGLAAGEGIGYTKLAADDSIAPGVISYTDGGAFVYVDTTINTPSNPIAYTSYNANAQFTVLTANTTNLRSNASYVVRLTNDAATFYTQSIDFEVGTVVDNTSFQIRWPIQNAPTAGTGGFYRIIPFNPYFYPRNRTPAAITRGTSTVVKTTVSHGYQIGQAVRFIMPQLYWGMSQINGLVGNITAVSTANNTFTVDIDSSGFDAFVWPTGVNNVFSWPNIVPIGEDSSVALANNVDFLTDRTNNQGFIGLLLFGGESFPAGADGDEIFWVAGKSFDVYNSGENVISIP